MQVAYTQYIGLQAQEMQLKEKHFDVDSRRFGLKEKKEEHLLHTDRERAELENSSAKRRSFDGSTDDAITFKGILAKAVESVDDAKGFK